MAIPSNVEPKEEPEDGKLDLFEDDDEFEEFEDEEWDDEEKDKLVLQQWEDDWDDDDVNDDFSQQLREELEREAAAVPRVTKEPSLPGLTPVPGTPVPSRTPTVEETTMEDQNV